MIDRLITKDILEWLDEKKIIIIKGARQVGKTTIMQQLIGILQKRNNQTLYFSVDQEMLNPIFETPQRLLLFLENEYDIKNKKTFLFLDEVQYIKNTGQFLKVLYDISKNYLNIIVSGSSSLKLSEKREFLTGRKVEFLMTPFSFREYLWAKSGNKYTFSWKLEDNFRELSEFYETYKDDLKANAVEFINWGGYPDVVLQSNSSKKYTLLKEIINTYIQKDVVDFLKVENINVFNNLIHILSAQIGNLVNKNELSNTLRSHFLTIEKYLNILENTFVFSFVKPFFKNSRKEISKMQKVYVNDLGIKKYYYNTHIQSYDYIERSLIENFAYNELKPKVEKNKVFYYRTISKSEIDFIINYFGELIPIEIKFTNVNKIPVAIKNFKEKYVKTSNIIIATKETLKKEKNIYFIPIILLPFIKSTK